MDISKWPVDHILQLPDNLLSRRYLVSCSLWVPADTTAWDISELALPDRCVVHEVVIVGFGVINKITTLGLALGDELPITDAQFDALEPFFMGLGLQGPEPRSLTIGALNTVHFDRLKMYVPAQGRRLVLEQTCESGQEMGVSVGIVVSGLPREIPDCLLSV